MTSVVEVRGVSKTFRLYHERAATLKEKVVNLRRAKYEEFWALKDVSLDIKAAETVGLIGPNGSGKSTLLKTIAGIIRPTNGQITTRGRIASLLELGAGFHPDLTGRENVYLNASILGLTRKQTESCFDQIVAFSELENFIDLQVRHYSSGMYVRLGFAVAIHVDPEILIIDEVLSVGDEAFQRKCLGRIRGLQRDGRTIIFVTHAVDMVKEICTRACFLHHGEVVVDGEPEEVVRTYRRTVHGEAHTEAAPDEERGNGQVKITNVAIVGADSKPRRFFSPGEKMQIEISLESAVRMNDVAAGIAIYDSGHRHVYGTNTVGGSQVPLIVDGKSTVVCTIPSLNLIDGVFALTVGITSNDERTVYHWREKAWSFTVVNDSRDMGSTRLAASFAIINADQRL